MADKRIKYIIHCLVRIKRMLNFIFSFKVKSLYDFVFVLFFFSFLGGGGGGGGSLFLHIFYVLEIYIFFNVKEDQNPIPD